MSVVAIYVYMMYISIVLDIYKKVRNHNTCVYIYVHISQYVKDRHMLYTKHAIRIHMLIYIYIIHSDLNG